MYSDEWSRTVAANWQTPCTACTTDTVAAAGAVAVVVTAPVAVAVTAAVPGGEKPPPLLPRLLLLRVLPPPFQLLRHPIPPSLRSPRKLWRSQAQPQR